MPEFMIPRLRVAIIPQITDEGVINGLQIVIDIESCQVAAGNPIAIFTRQHIGLTISRLRAQYHPSDQDEDEEPKFIAANVHLDDAGALIVDSDVQGYAVIIFYVYPVAQEEAGRYDELALHLTEGGILGSGMTFIPTPPGDQTYRNTVEWDLSNLPDGARAVWTYGEGPDVIEKYGLASILTESVYMVGSIQSNPVTAIPNTISDQYGYYWFGTLPPDMSVIKDMHHAFYLKIAEFFSSTPSASKPYRSFVHKNTYPTELTGPSFPHSHIFAYGPDISLASDYDLVRRLSLEITHQYLGSRISCPKTGTDWFTQGLKNLLSVYMPFRNKFRSGDYFSATINVLLTRYYTSPLLNVPHNQLLALAATGDAYAHEQLASRAWAFLIGTDLSARRKSTLTRPVEDLAIKPLAKLRAEGKPHGVEQWIKFLSPLMGSEARERYDAMLAGTTIILPPDLFTFNGGGTHYLQATDMEVLDFGMDRDSFQKGQVTGLKMHSRAQVAGLEEGDEIARNGYEWKCVDYAENKMVVVVLRADDDMQGVEVRFEYLPRAREKVEGWRMIKRGDE